MVFSRRTFESSPSLPDSSILQSFPNPHFFKGLAPLFLLLYFPAVRPYVSPGLPELVIPWPAPAQMVILCFKPRERQSCFCLSLCLCLLNHILQLLEWASYSLTRSWQPFTSYLSLFQQPETPSPTTPIPGSTTCLPWVPPVLFHNRGKGLCVPKGKFILLMILHLTRNPVFFIFGPAWLWQHQYWPLGHIYAPVNQCRSPWDVLWRLALRTKEKLCMGLDWEGSVIESQYS